MSGTCLDATWRIREGSGRQQPGHRVGSRPAGCLYQSRPGASQAGRYKEAINDYDRAIAIRPTAAIAFNNRGFTHQALGSFDQAKADYRHALDLQPDHPNVRHKNLAWLLATCPDDRYRDGAAAVEHACCAMELTGWKEDAWLPIVAAAYAEAGDFDAAVEWQSKAIDKLGEPADGERAGGWKNTGHAVRIANEVGVAFRSAVPADERRTYGDENRLRFAGIRFKASYVRRLAPSARSKSLR